MRYCTELRALKIKCGFIIADNAWCLSSLILSVNSNSSLIFLFLNLISQIMKRIERQPNDIIINRVNQMVSTNLGSTRKERNEGLLQSVFCDLAMICRLYVPPFNKIKSRKSSSVSAHSPFKLYLYFTEPGDEKLNALKSM